MDVAEVDLEAYDPDVEASELAQRQADVAEAGVDAADLAQFVTADVKACAPAGQR